MVTPEDRPPIVVVAVLDRDTWTADTDNLAVVDPARRRVLSIPRDLWSPVVGDRINRAWSDGGAALLLRALAERGIRAECVLCLRRGAVGAALAGAEVTVPVDVPLAFSYPRSPEERIEDGAVVVRFTPPNETLSGVRVHQWLGARSELGGGGSDLRRIRRQHTFVRALLRQGFDFARFVADPERVACSDDRAYATLALVDADWSFMTYDAVVPRRRDGKAVLVPATPLARGRRIFDRATAKAGRVVTGLVGRTRVPTGGWRPPRRRLRLIAALAVRDEERFLPGWLADVTPHVDGVVALDDGSSDGTVVLLEAHPSVLELLRRPVDRPFWDEVGNHRALVRAALEHGATWIVVLDADERVERDFRDRVERAVRRGRRLGLDAFALPMHELWDSPSTWRSDGPWGKKRVARLFAARPDHDFDDRALHAGKAPKQGRRLGAYVMADVRLYHLRMIDPVDRAARRARYEALDPDRRWQGVGYEYLTDETGLRLRPVRRRRGPAGA